MSQIHPLYSLKLRNVETEVIAFHGWGFDRNCWQWWQEHFTQQGSRFQAFDRGYFSNPLQPTFTDSNSTQIILAHSYGLHLCPIDLLQQADFLVILNSFLSFHPTAKAERRRSQLVLQQMIRQFEQSPEVVLQNFYRQSGYSQPCIDFQKINYQLLLEDLQQLNEAKLGVSCLESIPKILVFHSSDDRIVAASQSQEFLTALSHSCELISIFHAQHALPFTHAAECWSRLRSTLYSSISS